MAPTQPSRTKSKIPRLAKIKEMRSEGRRLDMALAPLEARFVSGQPVGQLDLRAVEGWVLSLAESYVVLAHTSMTPSAASASVNRVVDYIRSSQAKFLREAGTTSDDPMPSPAYAPSIFDIMD